MVRSGFLEAVSNSGESEFEGKCLLGVGCDVRMWTGGSIRAKLPWEGYLPGRGSTACLAAKSSVFFLRTGRAMKSGSGSITRDISAPVEEKKYQIRKKVGKNRKKVESHRQKWLFRHNLILSVRPTHTWLASPRFGLSTAVYLIKIPAPTKI